MKHAKKYTRQAGYILVILISLIIIGGAIFLHLTM